MLPPKCLRLAVTLGYSLNYVLILGILLAINCLLVDGRGAKNRTRLCRNFKHNHVNHKSGSYLQVMETENRTCPPTSAKLSVYHVTSSGDKSAEFSGKLLYLSLRKLSTNL